MLMIGRMIAIMIKPTTTVMTSVITGTSADSMRSTVFLASTSNVSATLQQHVVERAGFFADADHLQRKLRKPFALTERKG